MKYVSHLLKITTLLFVFSQSLSTHAQPLKILVAVEVFPCSIQPFILNQIIGLVDSGHEITIYAFRKNEYRSEGLTIPPIVYEYGLEKKTYYNEFPSDIKDYDIIFCQFGSTANKIMNFKDEYGNKPKLVSCFRGGDASTALIKNPHCYDTLYQEATYLLPVCNHFAKRLVKFGCPLEKIIVHHSAIDCDAFTYKERTWPQDNKVQILTVGRLHKEKGHEFTIQAVARLIKKYPNLEYTIIGSGPYQEKLQLLIDKLGMHDKIHLMGLIPHKDIPSYLAKAHLFMLTPITLGEYEDGKKVWSIGMEEGIPNALMEAMASGLPVIGTQHAGIPELIEDGVSGYVVPERNINAIYQRLHSLIAHPERWVPFGKAGRAHVLAEHKNEVLNARLHTLFTNLIG